MASGENSNNSRFNFPNWLQITVLSGLYAFAIGTGILSFFINPTDFQQLTNQHIYESASILGGTMLALITFEGIKDTNVYDDAEILLFSGIITALALFGAQIGLNQIAAPWYPVYNLEQPFAIQYGLLAILETTIAVGITVVLERKTELV